MNKDLRFVLLGAVTISTLVIMVLTMFVDLGKQIETNKEVI